MTLLSRRRWLAAAAALAAAPARVFAQPFPSKPITLWVPWAAGGATDISLRVLAELAAPHLGQKVLIENRGGAGGSVGAAEAARATPDGYTLFFPSGSVVSANQHIYARLSYDPDRDFIPVTKVVSGPQVLTVPASSPYKSVKELIDAARASPGKLTFGHAGIGSQTHLAAENFVWQAKIDALAVPYKGEGPGLASLVAGETSFFIGNVAASIGHIGSGRLRALGVTSKTEAPQLPGVPPIASTIPGFENTGWFGIVAPAGTPREIVQKVYRDTKRALEASDLRGRLYVQGLAPVADTPEEMAKAMKEESALWAKVVRERRIEVK